MKRVLLMLMITACGPVDLPVIIVPDAGDFVPEEPLPCTRTEDCMAGQLCEKSMCGDALGTCTQRPPVCDDELRPECGCDGVTYANSCLRRLAGVEASKEPGPCRMPRRCDTTSPCPGEATCARIVFPNECGRVVSGSCWVVPSQCSGNNQEHFQACGAQSQCLDLCSAVRSGQPMARFPGPCP